MEYIKGADLSTLLEVERCGGKFYKDGVQGDAIEILKSSGFNWVRLRVWHNPYDAQGNSYGAGVCDLPTLLATAKRVKAAGMNFLLDIHYSDFWTDPGKQYPPKAWQGMGPDQLEQAIYDYTKELLAACAQEGVSPQMVQVGNELTNGMLWPAAQLWKDGGPVDNWENLSRFLAAGVKAVREDLPSAKVMIHLDNGGNHQLYLDWFGNYFSRGGDCDVIGLSFYPFWHGTLADLKANLDDIGPRFGKPLVLAEVSMGFSTESYAKYEQLADDQRKGAPTRPDLIAKVGFPMTPQGQADFTAAMMKVLEEVPGGYGRGFFWWEPAWIPVPGSGWANQPGWEYVKEKGPGGNEWANQALFDYEGNALPAQEVIRAYQPK